MGGMDDLACQEFVELVTEYLEDTLASAERARFEAHLDQCPYCRTYLEQMRLTIATLGRLTAEAIPEEGKAEILRLFRAWREQ
jgi:anti-sigma factor RsiW